MTNPDVAVLKCCVCTYRPDSILPSLPCTQQKWQLPPAGSFIVTHSPLQKTLLQQGPGIVWVHSSSFVKQVSCRLQATSAAVQHPLLSPAMLGVELFSKANQIMQESVSTMSGSGPLLHPA